MFVLKSLITDCWFTGPAFTRFYWAVVVDLLGEEMAINPAWHRYD